jgi:hypothetical protein
MKVEVYESGRLLGEITEEWRDSGNYFVYWFYVNEIWEGYNFVRCEIDYDLVEPFIGNIVAMAQGTGNESRLLLVVEEQGVRARYWIFYCWRNGNLARVLRIRTDRPEYDKTMGRVAH